ncbi:hypothetical protein ABIA35_006574 [Catenulispora sp. MAP12-49]
MRPGPDNVADLEGFRVWQRDRAGGMCGTLRLRGAVRPVARTPRAWAVKNVRQAVSVRRGVAPIRRLLRILRMPASLMR